MSVVAVVANLGVYFLRGAPLTGGLGTCAPPRQCAGREEKTESYYTSHHHPIHFISQPLFDPSG